MPGPPPPGSPPPAAAPRPETRPPARIHAVVIGWAGRGAEARAIAAGLAPAVDRLTVIYSNHEGVPETGAGTWVGVPQDWYYGRKFAESLRRHRGEELMLQVQADAAAPDWPALVARLRAAWDAVPELGVWAPEVHVSPYRLQAALLARRAGDLHDAAQTDGVVWALARPVLDRLAAFDYARNDLGWGIDWTAFAVARSRGRAVLCDTGVTVAHPPSRGYSETDAEAQMAGFLAQLSPGETAWRLWSQDLVRTRKRMRPHAAGRWPLMRQGAGAPAIKPRGLRALVAEVRLARGRVLVRGAPDLDRRGVVLRAGGARHALVPLAGDPEIRDVPRCLEMVPHAAATHALGVTDPGAARGTGLPVARLEIRTAGPLSVPLGPALTIPGGTGDLELGAALAATGPGCVLTLRLEPLGPGPARGPETVAIPLGAGDGGLEDWHRGFARIPGAAHPRRAVLHLDRTGGGQAGGAAAVLVAAPHIVHPATQPDLVWPRRLEGAFPGPGRWFEAATGPLGRRTRLALVRGLSRQRLLAPAPRLAARLEDGALTVTGPRAGFACGVWLDGVPAFALELEAGRARVPIPVDPRPGGGLLELRDATGCRVIWQGPSPGRAAPEP